MNAVALLGNIAETARCMEHYREVCLRELGADRGLTNGLRMGLGMLPYRIRDPIPPLIISPEEGAKWTRQLNNWRTAPSTCEDRNRVEHCVKVIKEDRRLRAQEQARIQNGDHI